MAAPTLINRAFEDVAQSLRILLEADYHANRGGLLVVDRAEAVGNIESALSSVLNSFHSLYDAVGKEMSPQPVNWYESGPLALILAIRNARHHNKANKIRTLYSYHVHHAERPQILNNYVLVDFPSPDESAGSFDVYLSWEDMKSLLSLSQTESRLSPRACDIIRQYLCSDKFSDYAEFYDMRENSIFFNVVPLIVNAGATIVPLIKEKLYVESTETELFADHFSDVPQAIMNKPKVNCGPFGLPK